MDNYYAEARALRDYAAVTYETPHSYLIEGLRYWYELFPSSQEGGWADVDEAEAQAEDANEGAVLRADTIQPPATFNMVFRSAAASVVPPASAGSACGCGPGGCCRKMIEFNSLP
jgi:hypothetical protein